MALPSSGAIAFSDINTEIGVSATTLRSLNDAAVRTIFGQASGAVDMNTGHGKSYRVSPTFTFAANASNQTVALASLSGYIAGKSCITVTINAGVYVYSTNTAIPAITFTGGTTGDALTIVNLGKIMGMGGAGGSSTAGNGLTGGSAISINIPTTIDNTYASAYIGGGGGGAGAADSAGGGGAGGGSGGTYCGSGAGIGGTIGNIGGTGAGYGGRGGGAGGGGGGYWSNCGAAGGGGGGGGRIFPGTGGSGGVVTGGVVNINGLAGGAAGNVGGGGTFDVCRTYGYAGGGGGGWGASGGTMIINYQSCGSTDRTRTTTGGTGGKAVALNGKTVTWVSGCTARVYGSVS
jgi:hypothetical protein